MATLTKKQIAELEKSHTLCVVFRDGTAQTWKQAGMLSNFRKLDIIRWNIACVSHRDFLEPLARS